MLSPFVCCLQQRWWLHWPCLYLQVIQWNWVKSERVSKNHWCEIGEGCLGGCSRSWDPFSRLFLTGPHYLSFKFDLSCLCSSNFGRAMGAGAKSEIRCKRLVKIWNLNVCGNWDVCVPLWPEVEIGTFILHSKTPIPSLFCQFYNVATSPSSA